MQRKYTLGSLSHGTLLSQDLIPVFCDELRRLRGSVPLQLWRSAQACMRNDERLADEGQEVISDLIDELNNCAPPYFYFGAHPGDGSDFGFWLCEDCATEVRDSGGITIDDTSKVPPDFTGEVLHVNDHGNTTLYFAKAGKLQEIWAVV